MTPEMQNLVKSSASAKQQAKMDQMINAPAMKWSVTKILRLKHLTTGRIAIQIEAKGCWGVILPNGDFIRPKNGRKTIDNSDIAWSL